MGGNVVPSVTAAEHIGPQQTGDNIEAKRVAGYVWDPSTSTWVRDQGDSPTMAVRIDDATTADVTYIGKAPIGTATSAAAWQISKLATSSGLIKTWADGDASYNNVWDDRSSLTYV